MRRLNNFDEHLPPRVKIFVASFEWGFIEFGGDDEVSSIRNIDRLPCFNVILGSPYVIRHRGVEDRRVLRQDDPLHNEKSKIS